MQETVSHGSIVSIEMRRGGKRTKQYHHPTLLTTQADLNSSSHCGYIWTP